MRVSLYQKIFFWLLLNLVLLGLLAVALLGGLLVKGSNGLLPTYIFSSNVENVFRTISAHCQYKPVNEWAEIIAQYQQDDKLYYTLYSLEKGFYLSRMPQLPAAVRQAAEHMPRYPVTLCPDPAIVLPAYDPTFEGPDASLSIYSTSASQNSIKNMEAGIPTSPPMLFMRAGAPPRYWLARALFMPDEKHQLHYVLLAASSDSASGYGLFFDVNLILAILCGGLIVSCLWWWPFMRHITKPLLTMTAVAEKLTTGNASNFLNDPPGSNICGLSSRRKDEIGRLAQSINVMAQHLYGTLLRQRQFISHIAHEINSPLGRIHLGLAVMEDRLADDEQERVRGIIAEVDHLSVLTRDILNFLRAESDHQTPIFERIELCPFIRGVIDAEIPEGDVFLAVENNLAIHSSKSYLARAIGNILRNSLKHAGAGSLVEVQVTESGQQVRIDILDRGPGVPEQDIPLLARPFFRSNAESKVTGAGLGLSIVKYCIEACKGTIQFSNRKPSGFIVTILLPNSGK